MRQTLLTVLALAVTLQATINAAHSDDRPVQQWPQFRGPGGNAIATGQSIPLKFGPHENVRWETPLPAGHSSPCIWGNQIFITGYQDTTLKMICLDARNGKTRWEREQDIPKWTTYSHVAGSPANPTPTTDGARVVFLFDDYGIIVTDLTGTVLWEKELPPTDNIYSYGASPVLDQNRIYVNRDGGVGSCLLCLDATNGEECWRAKRPDADVSFCTPYLFDHDGRRLVLAGGTRRLVAYDTHTGKAAWHVTGLPAFICPSPVAANGLVFFGGWTTAHTAGRRRVETLFHKDSGVPPRALQSSKAFFARYDVNRDKRLAVAEIPAGRAHSAFHEIDEDKDGFISQSEWEPIYDLKPALPGRNVLLGIAAGGHGDVTDSHVRWEVTRGLPYVPSPLAYRDRVYLLESGGYITCVDASSGKSQLGKKRLGKAGEYYATPVAVGDHILICAQRGQIFVIKADDQMNVVHRTDLGETIFATPAIAHDTLYIRGEHHLWAFGD